VQNLNRATKEDLLAQPQTMALRFEVANDPVEVLVDGGLENWASATNLTYWTEGVGGTSTINRESTDKVAGSYSARFDIDGTNGNAGISQGFFLAPDTDYVLSFWWKAAAGKTAVVWLCESGWVYYLNTSGQWTSSQTGFILTGDGTWQYFSVTFRALAGFTSYALDLNNSSAASSSIYFDSVSLQATGWTDLSKSPKREALVDGNLECWTTSTDLTYWTEILGGTGTVTRAGPAGAYCALVTCDGAGNLTYFYQQSQMATLHRYTLRFWYKTNSGKTGAFYIMNTTGSYYLTSSGTWSTSVSYVTLPDTAGAWTAYEMSFITCPVGTTYNVSMAGQVASATIYYDEITLRPDVSHLKSMSCNVSGAGPSTEPLAGSWSVSLADPDLLFNPYNDTSPWAELIRLGRKARLSWGVQLGGHLRFDGTNDYVEVADNAALDITAAITLEAWVCQTTRTSWATVVTKGTSTAWSSNNYTLGLQSGRADFRWGGAGSCLVGAGDALVIGQWYHIVAVAETGTTNAIKVYINGVLKNTGARSGDPSANAQPLRFGTDAITTSSDYLNGRISDARIYDRALSATEVAEHYAQRFGNETGLVAHWPLSERSGNVADDAGPNGLDGTVYGATWARPQYLANETLEFWTSATDAVSWTEEKYGSSTVARESSIVHGGTYSVKCTVVAGANADLFQQVTLLPNTRYRFGGWYRSDGTANGWVVVYAGASFAYELRGDIGAPSWVAGTGQGMTPLGPTTSWTRFDCLFTTRSEYVLYLFAVGTHTSVNGSTYWDDLEVVPVDEETDALVWQRVVGFMDSPRFELGSGALSISGTDYMKVLTDTKLFSPWTYWGVVETFDSQASPGGTGSELYAEADACEVGAAEADNVTNWAVGGGGGTVSSEGPAPASSYYLYFERDAGPWVSEYAQNTNVASVTAGNTYKVTFQATKTGEHTAILKVYQTVGSSAVLLGTEYLDGGEDWLDHEVVINVTATGALRMRVESYGKYAASGDSISLDNVSVKLFDSSTWNQYELPPECNGVYYVVLDGEPVWQGDEDGQGGWHTEGGPGSMRLFFSEELIINAGTDNLDVYCFTDTAPEDVVADLMVAGDLYATRAAAKAAMNYTATGILLAKVWFEPGTPALDAVRLLCERVNYRFWFSADGTPNFVPAPVKATPAHFDLPAVSHMTDLALYQDIDEVRNHVTIEGCERSVLNVSTGQVERSTWKSAGEDPDSILLYQRNTYSLSNHLFQDQVSVDDAVAALLAYYKEPKYYLSMTLNHMPVPLAVGDTVSFLLPIGGGATTAKQGIVRSLSLNDFEMQLLLELYVPITTLLTVQDATMGLAADSVTLDYAGALAPSDALMGMAADSPTIQQVFTYTTYQNGTSLSVPSGASQVIIECWGSGGDGGDGELVGRAGGGGGGAYSKTTVSVSSGQSLLIYLDNLSDAVVTRSSTTLCLAKCGEDGDLTGGGAGGAAASGTGDTKYSGGNGYYYATGNTGGGGGSSAGTAGNGNNATSSSGASAVTGGGPGGAGGARYNDGYTPASGPGGGGGGAGSDLSTERYGGAGYIGKVRITFS